MGGLPRKMLPLARNRFEAFPGSLGIQRPMIDETHYPNYRPHSSLLKSPCEADWPTSVPHSPARLPHASRFSKVGTTYSPVGNPCHSPGLIRVSVLYVEILIAMS